jgi:hypothetical protein
VSDARYLDWALDVGAYWLPLHEAISPIVGGGITGQIIDVRDPTVTTTTGSVLRMTVRSSSSRVDGGVGGSLRAGVLFGRYSIATGMLLLDYRMTFMELARPGALILSFGVIF